MSPKDILGVLKDAKDVFYNLLGEKAGHALYVIFAIAALLYLSRSLGGGVARLADMALLLCVLFGIVVTAYGIFTHQNIAGLKLQKGFAVGTLAGALAACTGGAAYYSFDTAQCCHDDGTIKLFRLLAASVPMGAVFGAMMGLLRPARQQASPVKSQESSKNFLSFLLGLFLLLVLSLAYFFIFDNVSQLSGARVQGLLLFWQVSVLLISFTIAYVFLIVFLYGREDEESDAQQRLLKAISSSSATVLCAAVLFSGPIWVFANADFRERAEITVCQSTKNTEADQCVDCIDNVFCPSDPKNVNNLEGILLRTIVLIALVFATYVSATHRRSPVVKALDRLYWVKESST